MASESSELFDLSIQQVSTQKLCRPSRLACSPQNRIFSYPTLFFPLPSIRSPYVTSSISAPHVCERIAYSGILPRPKSLVRLNSLSLLHSSRRIIQTGSERMSSQYACSYLSWE